MDKLFLTVLNMSLTGAFVIAAVMLARLPLKKAPKIISYCLWAVAGFRLVFPFSIESIFSLMPIKPQPIPPDIAMQAVPRIDSGISMVNNAVSSVLPAATPDASVNPLQIFMAIYAHIWLVGVIVMVTYNIVSYVLLKRRMRTAIRVEENIYETDNIGSPFVLGIIKPKIFLPLSLASSERDYIILHERTHIRRHDHIIKFAAFFVLCLHWFNPLVWAAFLLIGVDMEMSCDERVLKEIGGETKHDYSRSLLSLATQRRMIGGSPLAFGEGGVKGRIKNVLNFKKPSRVIIIAAVALVAVLSVGFAVNRESSNIASRPLDLADVQKMNGKHYEEVHEYLGEPDGQLSGMWGEIYDLADGRFAIIYYDRNGYVENILIDDQTPVPIIVDAVTIIVWENADNQTCYSLYDGNVIPAPSELSGDRVFSDIAELNAALADYPRDLLSMAHIKHTMGITKDEAAVITENIVLPSDNYGKSTGYYEFHITTLDEAREIVGVRYPGWPDITFVGEDTISYTNPPKPVEVYKFEVVVSGLVETCAVAKERGIFFNYSNRTWLAFTGAAEWSGATQNMTLDDVRAIAQKIGADLTMGDLRDFIGTDVGSGLYVMQYYIENSDYMLIVGSGDMNTVMYANLIHATDGGANASIDIRYYDVDKFIKDEAKVLVRPLPKPLETTPPNAMYELIQRVESSLSIIMSSPKTSSNPQDYINAHQEEYDNLAFKYSEGVLDYLLSEFEAGDSEGLRGHIMMRICKDILGLSNNVTDESLSPQDWYSQLSVISQTWLPDFEPDNPTDEYEKLAYFAITQFYSQLDYGFLVSAPTVYGAYEEEGKLKIFMTVYYLRYRLFGKTLESIGGGVIPGAAICRKNESNGEWMFEEYLEVGSATLPDGMYFNNSIQNLCVMPVSGRELEGLAKTINDDYVNEARQELLLKNLIKHLLAHGQMGVSLRTSDGELIELT